MDDIELTLFESAGSSLPRPATVERLAALAEGRDLTYTVHFPLDRKLGAESARERAAMQKAILAIIRLMRPLKPLAWVLHFEGLASDPSAPAIKAWRKRIAGVMPPIIAEAGDPGLICVENLLYPFEWCLELVDSFKLGVCVDIGHLLLKGIDAGAHLERFLPLAKVIHLHGVRAGKTHQKLNAIPAAVLRELLAAAAGFKGVLTLEIFNLPDLSASIEYLDHCLASSPMRANYK